MLYVIYALQIANTNERELSKTRSHQPTRHRKTPGPTMPDPRRSRTSWLKPHIGQDLGGAVHTWAISAYIILQA